MWVVMSANEDTMMNRTETLLSLNDHRIHRVAAWAELEKEGTVWADQERGGYRQPPADRVGMEPQVARQD